MLRRLRASARLALSLLVLSTPSCGSEPPALPDPCRLDRCAPEGVVSTMCSPLDERVTTTLDEAAKFLYGGPDPLQVGLDPNALDSRRVAVLRGKVTHEGAAVTGATIAITGHPEYGTTRSQCNGAFDRVVNGGAPLTVSVEGTGYLPVRRRVGWGR